ncbi:hypothetical protein MPTK1_3g22360 [Marchantia polymorpha subsp. ruderalis]|uniref:Uncharacterized protein n=2 Tax=Marchantia polymorpha TaxID=3197 RepID=A0AAF6B3J4_MARPO|nr:hypothetical protein MARPO_0024s0014 [Marchantia polymorpha]BBN06578.1 hypothetical protein Mp_3g22360 [Marchantia polymorpha subsp. ruderalis]|eukprot:PTQ43478.1 hypothetical protein MARPO_0024s0014 [Marchantia polymorpha]
MLTMLGVKFDDMQTHQKQVPSRHQATVLLSEGWTASMESLCVIVCPTNKSKSKSPESGPSDPSFTDSGYSFGYLRTTTPPYLTCCCCVTLLKGNRL